MSADQELWQRLNAEVELQAVYLANPRNEQPLACPVCFGAKGENYQRCHQCQKLVGSQYGLIDALAPVSYALQGEQHAQNLQAYKFPNPSSTLKTRLTALAWTFLRRHKPCLFQAAGGEFTHYTVVPSTRNREGPHPLTSLVQLTLPSISVEANPACPTEREVRPDRFQVSVNLTAARVLILDDTWTTGSRVQSLSHTLKAAGATTTVAVVLGRWLTPSYSTAVPLWEAARQQPFTIHHCVLTAH